MSIIEAGIFHRIKEAGRRTTELALNKVVIEPITKVRQIHEPFDFGRVSEASLYGLISGTAIAAIIGQNIGPSNISITFPMLLAEGYAFLIVGHAKQSRSHERPT